MDRNIVYPGAIPLDTDLLSPNLNAMIGLGFLAQAVLGTSTVVDGLACQPTTPASMSVTITPARSRNSARSIACPTDPYPPTRPTRSSKWA